MKHKAGHEDHFQRELVVLHTGYAVVCSSCCLLSIALVLPELNAPLRIWAY